MRVSADVAEALEHAVAVVVGKDEEVGRNDAGKARRAALERAIGVAVRGRSGEEEKRAALDEGLVAIGEAIAAELLVEPVGQRAAAELILQRAIAVVEHGHGGTHPLSFESLFAGSHKGSTP